MKNSESVTQKEWLETKDVLQIYGISRNTLKKWMAEEIVPQPEIDTGRMKRWHYTQILKA
jgi:predicted DNA-binding transcriptional regulator AlpA